MGNPSHGNKGKSGAQMHIVGKKRKPAWMKLNYEQRIASRDRTSAKRLARLEAKGKIEHQGTTVAIHTCGTPTTLEARYCDISGRRGHYASYCPACKEFAQG